MQRIPGASQLVVSLMSKYCSINDSRNLQNLSYAGNPNSAIRTLDMRGGNECVSNKSGISWSQLLADSKANTKDDARTDNTPSEL